MAGKASNDIGVSQFLLETGTAPTEQLQDSERARKLLANRGHSMVHMPRYVMLKTIQLKQLKNHGRRPGNNLKTMSKTIRDF